MGSFVNLICPSFYYCWTPFPNIYIYICSVYTKALPVCICLCICYIALKQTRYRDLQKKCKTECMRNKPLVVSILYTHTYLTEKETSAEILSEILTKHLRLEEQTDKMGNPWKCCCSLKSDIKLTRTTGPPPCRSPPHPQQTNASSPDHPDSALKTHSST